MQSYSQDHQDEYLYHTFFQGKKDGFYVEIGALDGITISNSLLFHQLGWKGMLIEANPEQYELMRRNRAHPNTICVYGAAYCSNTSLTFRINDGYTTALSGIENCYDDRHVQRIARENALHGCQSKFVQVPAYRTQDLFEKHGIHIIDYLSIDVEGGEFAVLEGIDFDKTMVHVLSVEDNYGELPKYKQLLQKHMEHVGRIGCDEIFVHRNG